jgi:adenosylcobinamide kinase/adenosylcobinamide-phosphate guanylyltransferase
MVVADQPPAAHLTLVSGPARSGKSRWAEHLARLSGLAVVYIATGPLLPDDPAWQARLALHRSRRPSDWRSLEVEGCLAAALGGLTKGELALVDSLGTWVAAHLDLERPAWQERCDELHQAMQRSCSPLVLVCEETGWGVVPATVAGGRFRDRLGLLQQRLASHADASWLVLQGRAIDLLSLGQPVPGEA